MPNLLHNKKAPVPLRRVELFCLFVALMSNYTHLWKLQCYHAILFGYCPACPKFSEITNRQYLWKAFSDFVDFLHVVICILLDIHWSYKICYFGLALSSINSQPTRFSDVLNLKNSKTMWGTKLIFCYHWSYEKYANLGYGPQKFLADQFAEFFTFDVFNLLILVQRVHCYIVLVFLKILFQFKNLLYRLDLMY